MPRAGSRGGTRWCEQPFRTSPARTRSRSRHSRFESEWPKYNKAGKCYKPLEVNVRSDIYHLFKEFAAMEEISLTDALVDAIFGWMTVQDVRHPEARDDGLPPERPVDIVRHVMSAESDPLVCDLILDEPGAEHPAVAATDVGDQGDDELDLAEAG
jgi:hypothetical protein